MKIWVTSDLHFGHANIMKFCPQTRGHFRDVEHMNGEMIREWNTSVQGDDVVYILGDFAFLNAERAVSILRRLAGRKILIEGNHDRKLLQHDSFRECFDAVHVYHETTIDKTLVCMFHYPIMEWNRMHHGSVHLYGHVHGKPSGLEQFRARDAGMDATGRVVVPMSELVGSALKGAIKSHH